MALKNEVAREKKHLFFLLGLSTTRQQEHSVVAY